MDEQDSPTRWRVAAALALIVVAAAALRLPFPAAQGVLSVDEGRYLLDAQSKLLEWQVWGGMVAGKLAERRGEGEFLLSEYLPEAHARLARRGPFLPKVLFSGLLAGVMAVSGGFNVWAGNVVEGLFGVAGVALTYWLGARLAGRRAGLLAAAALALSCWHVYYARNTYPQASSGFFLLLGVALHYLWWRRGGWAWALAAGGAAGLAFLSNFQAAGALPLLVGVHGAACLLCSGERIRRLVVGAAALSGGFAVALFLAEAETYPLVLLFHSAGMRFPHQTFLELLLPRVTMHSGVGWNPEGAVLFPYFLWRFEGMAAAIVLGLGLVAGVAWAWARLRVRESRLRGAALAVYALVPFLIPWALFSFKTLQGARTFVYVLPFFAILFGAAVATVWDAPGYGRKYRRMVVGVLLAAAACSSLLHNAEVLRTRSAYPAVTAYLAGQEDARSVASWTAVLESYLDAAGLEGGALGVYLAAEDPLPPHYVSDWQWLYEEGPYPDEPPVLLEGTPVAATFEHRFGRIFLEAELLHGYGDTLHNLRHVRALDLQRARQLLVYRIDRGDIAPAE